MSFIYWGADAYTYLISSIVIAIISGYFGHQTIKQNTYPSIRKGAIISAITEIIQMGCILYLQITYITQLH